MVEDLNKMDIEKAYILDDGGFFIGTMDLDHNKLSGDFKYTFIKPKEDLIKPRFDGDRWVEGVSSDEVMVNMLVPDLKFVDRVDFLLLKILDILRRGDVMMENKWFFNYCMFCWAQRKIEENYLDMAKKLDLLSDEQIMMIKMTPRVVEKKEF